MHFWKSVLIKEQTFRKEETWANALIRSGPPLWLFLSIIFLLYSITTQNVSTNIRVSGSFISFWIFYSYIIFGRYFADNKVSVRILSLKPISKSNLKMLKLLHERTMDAIRNSNLIAFGIFILYSIFFILNIKHINLSVLIKVHLPILAILIILSAYLVQVKAVILPFLRLHSRDELTMATGSNILSVDSMRFLLDLLFPFILLIAVNLLLSFLSQCFKSYSDDFAWLKQPWIFLFGFYVILSLTHATLRVCVPIFMLMTATIRTYALWSTFICFIACLVIGSYSVSFCIPFLFSVILNSHDVSSNITKFKGVLIIIKAVLSGLSSVVTSWLLNLSGIKLLFYSDVYVGLIVAILFDHIISFYSYQRTLVSE